MPTYRKYRITDKVKESEAVVSLYLSPLDGLPLEPYRPGQHLMVKVTPAGETINHFRHYSFSDCPNGQHYRLSIKREMPRMEGGKPGKCSNHIHDGLAVGDVIEAKGPMGDFSLDPEADTPVALIAGGIGVTPLLSMAKSIVATNPERQVYFLYGVTGAREHAFKDELWRLKACGANFRLVTYYAEGGAGSQKGVDFDREGFVSVDDIAKALPLTAVQYYICGPVAMMDHIANELSGRGVAHGQVHRESFVSGVQDAAGSAIGCSGADTQQGTAIEIVFSRSEMTLVWDSRYGSILAFAEDNGIEIPSSCLFGDCGTCLTRLIAGEVRQLHPTLVKPNPGECLVCSCVPIGNISLDA